MEFVLSPVSLPYTFGYAMSYFILKGTDQEVAPPDWRENVRNFGLWSGMAATVFTYNAIMHPGKYGFVSPGKAFGLATKLTPPVVVVPALLAAPMAIGYVANRQVIETMPQHEQQPFWASIGQALAGTGFGVGGSKSGIIP